MYLGVRCGVRTTSDRRSRGAFFFFLFLKDKKLRENLKEIFLKKRERGIDKLNRSITASHNNNSKKKKNKKKNTHRRDSICLPHSAIASSFKRRAQIVEEEAFVFPVFAPLDEDATKYPNTTDKIDNNRGGVVSIHLSIDTHR